MNELLKNKYVIFSLFLVVLFVIMNYLLKVKFMTSAILSFLLAMIPQMLLVLDLIHDYSFVVINYKYLVIFFCKILKIFQ